MSWSGRSWSGRNAVWDCGAEKNCPQAGAQIGSHGNWSGKSFTHPSYGWGDEDDKHKGGNNGRYIPGSFHHCPCESTSEQGSQNRWPATSVEAQKAHTSCAPITAPTESVADAIAHGFSEEEMAQGGRGGEILDFLRLLPSKDWVPFGSFELEPSVGVWGSLAGEAVDFYLKPNLMPVGGFGGWKVHPVYQKDLAFVKKDTQQEVRLNKEISTRWTSTELLAFAEVRSCEFDVANVITTVHRIAKSTDRWFVKRDPRLKQVLAQAVDIVCDPERKATARDVAKAMWSMARMNSSDCQAQDKLSQEILRRLESFEPQGLSNILWSYAKIGVPNRTVLEPVLHNFQCMVIDGICEPQALSNVTWALAKLIIFNEPILKEIALETFKKAEQFDPQGLANIAWAFATLLQDDAPLLEHIGAILAANPTKWQPQNIANLTWAFAKLLVIHEGLLDVVATETVATIDDWNTQGLANIAWAYAKLGVNSAPLFGKIAGVVLQKIRTFSPQNTVNIAWAYAKLCIARTDLMDAVAEDVIKKVKDFSPQHCSNTAWAFGIAGLLNEDMMESLATVVDKCVSEFNGQDLANVSWSCAKLVWARTDMLDMVASNIVVKISSLTPQNVAIIAWSFGCLARAHVPMMTAIAEECPSRVREFGAQGLSNLAHGFAKLGFSNLPAMEAIAEEAAKTIRAFTNQEFTMLVWAYAKLGISSNTIIEAVINETKRRINQLLPQDLATCAWSFARLGVPRSKEALEEISWEVLKQVLDLGPQDLSNISWAYATAGLENTMMMEAISQEVVKKIDNFIAQDIANTAWAFAKLGIVSCDMFDSVALAVTRKVRSLLPQNLSIVCWAYAKVGLVNDVMMEAVACEISRKIDDFDGQGIGNIMWSFGVLGLRQYAELYEKLVRRALEISDALTSQEISNIAWGLFALKHEHILHAFIPKAVCCFTRVVKEIDGASWVDFANIVAHVANSGLDGPGVHSFNSAFRGAILEPLLNALLMLKDQSVDMPTALENMQRAIETVGAPYFGSHYGMEVLSRLAISIPGSSETWQHEARRKCFETVRGWQIPNMDTIVAFARWEVWNPRYPSHMTLHEPGRVFLSGWSVGICDALKELVHPFMQLTRRDMCAERVALLEFLDALAKINGSNNLERLGGYDQVFHPYEGSVQLYLSHFPSLSSLGVLCQFQRRLPKVKLHFDFDNAWLTCCGVPRFDI